MMKENIQRLREDIDSVCRRCGRHSQEITLVAITKNASSKEIIEAVNSGISDIGENRIQEIQQKYKDISGAKFHLVGHLQTNKVKEAVRLFDLIHSVDSLRVAAEIDKKAAKIAKVQEILMQVNTSEEESKFGLDVEESIESFEQIAGLKNVRIRGLMTIAPLVDDAEKTRVFFRQLRELRDKLNSLHITPYALRDLSMGMTNDYKVAIEEGSTMLRIGRAIFQG